MRVFGARVHCARAVHFGVIGDVLVRRAAHWIEREKTIFSFRPLIRPNFNRNYVRHTSNDLAAHVFAPAVRLEYEFTLIRKSNVISTASIIASAGTQEEERFHNNSFS